MVQVRPVWAALNGPLSAPGWITPRSAPSPTQFECPLSARTTNGPNNRTGCLLHHSVLQQQPRPQRPPVHLGHNGDPVPGVQLMSEFLFNYIFLPLKKNKTNTLLYNHHECSIWLCKNKKYRWICLSFLDLMVLCRCCVEFFFVPREIVLLLFLAIVDIFFVLCCGEGHKQFFWRNRVSSP